MKCFCGQPALISRDRFREGEWVCITHAAEDAKKDAEHRDYFYPPFRVSEFFIRRMRQQGQTQEQASGRA